MFKHSIDVSFLSQSINNILKNYCIIEFSRLINKNTWRISIANIANLNEEFFVIRWKCGNLISCFECEDLWSALENIR